MSLLGLPTEILDQIADLTLWPSSFESLALSCKPLYEVCKGYIPRYNELSSWGRVFLDSKKYRIPSVPNFPARSPYTVKQILLAIAKDPAIAFFIEELDLYNIPEWTKGWEINRRDAEDTLSELKDMIRSSPYVALSGKDPAEWFVHVDRPRTEGHFDDVGFVNYQTAFLLTLLPNLRELRLPTQWIYVRGEAEGCLDVLDAIARHCHDSFTDNDRQKCQDKLGMTLESALPKYTPLAKLERILPYAPVEYDPPHRSGLIDVAPFMLLPDLNHLHVSNLIAVDDNYTGIAFEWPYNNRESGLQDTISLLETIQLEGCIVDHSGISNLLSRTPRLRSLRYSHHTKWHGCAHDWDAATFVKQVPHYVGDTLQDLALNLDWIGGDVESGVTSLQEFKMLESFEADVRLFCAPPVDKNGEVRDRSSWKIEEIPPLHEILPKSIKNIKLISRDSGGDGTDVENLAALEMLSKNCEKLLNRDLFPNFEGVTIVTVEDGFKRSDVHALADRVGWTYFEIDEADVVGRMPRG